MNPKIKEALSNTKTGDVELYFDELSKIIEKNSGTHENKLIIAVVIMFLLLLLLEIILISNYRTQIVILSV